MRFSLSLVLALAATALAVDKKYRCENPNQSGLGCKYIACSWKDEVVPLDATVGRTYQGGKWMLANSSWR